MADEIEWGEWGPIQQGVFPRQSQSFDGDTTQWRYPVPKKPVVEKATVWGQFIPEGGGIWVFSGRGRGDTHRITLTIIDGVVQPIATVEAL